MIGVMLAALLTATAIPPDRRELDRPVADIVSPIWSDPAHRDAAHEVEQIVARLYLRRGARVADIGAGSGYDTLRLAKAVGSEGRVVAEDVTPAYLQQLRRTVDIGYFAVFAPPAAAKPDAATAARACRG